VVVVEVEDKKVVVEVEVDVTSIDVVVWWRLIWW